MAPSILKQLLTLADNNTPSQRKLWAFAAGVIILAMGVAHIALAAWSVAKGNPYDGLAFGTGGAALAAVLVALPVSLSKAMEMVPDTTAPQPGGEVGQ